MKEHVNLLHVSEESLELLSKENDTFVGGEKAYFIERSSVYGGHGFHVDMIVFKNKGKFYKFAAIRYLKEELTLTVPYEVFHKEETYTRNIYSNWVADEEENEF